MYVDLSISWCIVLYMTRSCTTPTEVILPMFYLDIHFLCSFLLMSPYSVSYSYCYRILTPSPVICVYGVVKNNIGSYSNRRSPSIPVEKPVRTGWVVFRNGHLKFPSVLQFLWARCYNLILWSTQILRSTARYFSFICCHIFKV